VIKRLGLIVNPIAGIGGRVGLKGSDGAGIQMRARALGAVPRAQSRAIRALEQVKSWGGEVEIVTYPLEMGEDAARACGFEPTVIGSISPGETTAEDTGRAAGDMLDLGVSLLLFAGGDGTARDVCSVAGEEPVVLGIPAGVKIHSAVYATNPINAGSLAVLYLDGKVRRLRAAEVMDTDEEALRRGGVATKLYGYLRVPCRPRMVQSLKLPSEAGEEAAMAAVAEDVVSQMERGWLYILGPGTTTRAIAHRLGVEKTLIGVDVVADGRLVVEDANEERLLEFLEGRKAKVVVTPIGGQGCIFGRGNQQISPRVLEKVGRENIVIVSTSRKIHSLGGRPLWVDTGDREVDGMLDGYIKVTTGWDDQIVYRVAS